MSTSSSIALAYLDTTLLFTGGNFFVLDFLMPFVRHLVGSNYGSLAATKVGSFMTYVWVFMGNYSWPASLQSSISSLIFAIANLRLGTNWKVPYSPILTCDSDGSIGSTGSTGSMATCNF